MKRLIKEQEEIEDFKIDQIEPKAHLSGDSVDDQIDSHILLFETRSVEKDEFEVAKALQERSMYSFLVEQEENEQTVDKPQDSSALASDEPVEELLKPALDVDIFTKNIARLILNYDSLLRIPQVIINRAKNYLSEEYDESHVDRFINILNEQFDVNVEEDPYGDVDDAPNAVGARDAAAGQSGAG